MSRRWMLALLVPALVGSMVGVGLAAWQPPASVAVAGAGNAAAVDPAAGGNVPEASQTPRQFVGTPERPRPLVEVVADDEQRRDRDRAAREDDDSDGEGYDVAAVQRVLAEQRYYVGPIDGEAGSGTASAVMAFQKVHGLAADGVVGAQTLAALEDPQAPALRGGAADRVEIDLTKQVLYLVRGGSLERIVPVSSGSGDTYATSTGGTARSLTPVGTFVMERHISGVREAALGTLYDPMYFYRGWAIHGSDSVPPWPASHGCVRVTRSDALWLFDRIPVGMQISLYGGTHTFTAGSSAPGTSAPAGDTAATLTEQTSADQPEAKPEAKPDAKPADKPADKPDKATPDTADRRDQPSQREADQPAPEPKREPEPKPAPEPSPGIKPSPKPSPDQTSDSSQVPERSEKPGAP